MLQHNNTLESVMLKHNLRFSAFDCAIKEPNDGDEPDENAYQKDQKFPLDIRFFSYNAAIIETDNTDCRNGTQIYNDKPNQESGRQ
jgi:hypothetical protein